MEFEQYAVTKSFTWTTVEVDGETSEKEVSKEWTTVSRYGHIRQNIFTNTWGGYSYFFNEGYVNRDFKLTFEYGIPEGASICFGFIPAVLLDEIR